MYSAGYTTIEIPDVPTKWLAMLEDGLDTYHVLKQVSAELSHLSLLIRDTGETKNIGMDSFMPKIECRGSSKALVGLHQLVLITYNITGSLLLMDEIKDNVFLLTMHGCSTSDSCKKHGHP